MESKMTGRFWTPTEVVFGEGVAGTLAQHVGRLGARRLWLVTDPGVRAAGIVERVAGPLAGLHGIEVTVWDAVHPNPRDAECEAGAAAAREAGADLVVAVGGGSPLDAAKAIAALATNGGAVADWITPRALDRPALPMIAIPTTAGTGSEVTRSSVITDTARRIKVTIKDPSMAPRVALVDPELTWSLPAHVTAATGMDILTHAVEAYTCRQANPISDGLALHAIRLVARSLAAVVRDGSDHGARATMMVASTMAGMAFANADVAGVHCLAEALGGRYDTPHGVANAVFLPHFVDFHRVASPRRHAEVAAALGIDVQGQDDADAAAAGATMIAGLALEVGIPVFASLPGIDPADFPALAAAAEANGSNPSNSRPMVAADYQTILARAWAGGAA